MCNIKNSVALRPCYAATNKFTYNYLFFKIFALYACSYVLN